MRLALFDLSELAKREMIHPIVLRTDNANTASKLHMEPEPPQKIRPASSVPSLSVSSLSFSSSSSSFSSSSIANQNGLFRNSLDELPA